MWDRADYVRFVRRLTESELDDRLEILRCCPWVEMNHEKRVIVQEEIERRTKLNVGSGI